MKNPIVEVNSKHPLLCWRVAQVGLDNGRPVFERSEFWPDARPSEQRSEAAGQHKGCPGVVRGMGTHSPDSTLSRNKWFYNKSWLLGVRGATPTNRILWSILKLRDSHNFIVVWSWESAWPPGKAETHTLFVPCYTFWYTTQRLINLEMIKHNNPKSKNIFRVIKSLSLFFPTLLSPFPAFEINFWRIFCLSLASVKEISIPVSRSMFLEGRFNIVLTTSSCSCASIFLKFVDWTERSLSSFNIPVTTDAKRNVRDISSKVFCENAKGSGGKLPSSYAGSAVVKTTIK